MSRFVTVLPIHADDRATASNFDAYPQADQPGQFCANSPVTCAARSTFVRTHLPQVWLTKVLLGRPGYASVGLAPHRLPIPAAMLCPPLLRRRPKGTCPKLARRPVILTGNLPILEGSRSR